MHARHFRRASAALTVVGLLALLVEIGFTQPPRPARKVAFLVGVSKYDHDFDELKYAERDVEELAKVLRAGGFEVVLLTGSAGGATKQTITTRLKELVAGGGDDAKRVRKGDTVFVALCGHGVQKEVTVGGRTREDAFFCPVNAKSNDPNTMVSLSWITDEVLAPCGSRNLLVVDACRSVADPNRGRGIEGKDISLKGETAVLFGCGRGEVSFESEKAGGGHGLLTYAVLGGLRGQALRDGGAVTWQSLVAHVESAFASQEFRGMLTPGKSQTPVSASAQVKRVELMTDADVARWHASTRTSGGVVENAAAAAAERVKFVLDQFKLKSVVVGEFHGSGRDLPGNAGTAVRHALIRELEKRNVSIDRNARFEMKGDYVYRLVPNHRPADPEKDAASGLVRLRAFGHDHLADGSSFRIDARMYDNERDKSFDLRGVNLAWPSTDPRLAVFFGLTVADPALPVPKDIVDRPKTAPESGAPLPETIIAVPGARPRIQDAMTDPQAFVVGTEVRATAASPYGVEVLVKDTLAATARAVKPTVENGLAFAPIKRGQYYEVQVSNRTTHMTAVTLTIDGLDQYAFSDLKDKSGNPLYEYFLLRPGTVYAVRGWHRTNERADSFLITEYAKSAAAERMISAAKVGTITATFAAAWEKDKPAPPGESFEIVEGYRGKDGKITTTQSVLMEERAMLKTHGSAVVNATGRGGGVKVEIKEIPKPTVGRVREVVTVRYNKN